MSAKTARVVQGFFVGGRPACRAGCAPRALTVQRRGQGDAFQLPDNFASLGNGPGQPLPTAVREKMESAFGGASFEDVRVHVGQQATSIGALAFTLGTDLYFAPGQYNPQTLHGQQLLGHELTHVVQQRAGRVRNPFGSGLAVVQDHAMEAEADRMGHLAAQAPMPRLAQPKMAPAAEPAAHRHAPPVYRPQR